MSHIAKLTERFPGLEACRADLDRALEMLLALYRSGGKLLLCGNGGSAADADHWSAELLKQFMVPRPIPENMREALGEQLADGLQQGLPAIPLSAFNAFSSAYANDCEGVFAFAQLVYTLGRPGDALVGISTSGKAENVCLALRTARARGLATIGLTGRTGGCLPPLCDVCIRVPEDHTYRVQELHQPIYHALCLDVENALFGPKRVR